MSRFELGRSTSLYSLPPSGSYQEPDLLKLEELIEFAARLLPAEGPIAAFVFQNPLHSFEYLPFDEAVRKGSALFGCEPYLSEERYRAEVARDRIRLVDLHAVLEEEDRDANAGEAVGGIALRREVRLNLLLHPVARGTDAELRWLLAETQAFSKFHAAAPAAAQARIVGDARRWVVRDLINAGSVDGAYRNPAADDPRRRHLLWPLLPVLKPVLDGQDRPTDGWSEAIWDEFALRSLWRVCCDGVRHAPTPDPEPARSIRPRDLLRKATGVDSDALVNGLLIPFCAAFTDQGLAQWPMPERDAGFFRAFIGLYRERGGPPDRWLRGLAAELKAIDDRKLGAMESVLESLELLGISADEWEDFLPATMLALRGWGSMIRQMEVRADRVPHPVPRGTLIEFLAVRLLLERHALAHVARAELGYEGPLADLRTVLRDSERAEPTIEQRALPLFQIAQWLGWQPTTLHSLSRAEWADLMGEIESFSELERRRIFQRALERRFRTQALDALAARAAVETGPTARPTFQAAFCIDTREESFRRHLEEIHPGVETFGVAGFFGVPIYYRGAADAHPVASCPIVIRPQHWVNEEVTYSLTANGRQRALARRLLGTTSLGLHRGSRMLARGAVLTGGLGLLASFPLVARVLFPRWASALSKFARSVVAPPPVTRLTIERSAPLPGSDGDHLGFNIEEMTAIGERVLRDIGLTSNFARLVLFLGHGSQCMNNPHKSVYDCGACSGAPGGPNARALAAILNDPRVRDGLAKRGLEIPWETLFLGGLHNTGDDSVTFYDLDRVPKAHVKDLESARHALELACGRNARERCRRFDSAPLGITEEIALRHVHGRTEDLAQPRPEFGNATNAVCVVGRRSLTRGLYLDRRCFLHSYDPTHDDADHTILARILGAVVPVCHGINTQYYFSATDPAGWGCGTKLPHNITGLLGVMDGAMSDLRQGLPWQGVEIHEPLRLLFVVETTPAAMFSIMERNPVVSRILGNGWAQLAVLPPGTSQILAFRDGAFVPYRPVENQLPTASSSLDWFAGRRDHLGFAEIQPRS